MTSVKLKQPQDVGNFFMDIRTGSEMSGIHSDNNSEEWQQLFDCEA